MVLDRVELHLHRDGVARVLEHQGCLLLAAGPKVDPANIKKLIADLESNLICKGVFAYGADKNAFLGLVLLNGDSKCF